MDPSARCAQPVQHAERSLGRVGWAARLRTAREGGTIVAQHVSAGELWFIAKSPVGRHAVCVAPEGAREFISGFPTTDVLGYDCAALRADALEIESEGTGRARELRMFGGPERIFRCPG